VVENGEIIYDGKDLLKLGEAEFHNYRGSRIAMIFQTAEQSQPHYENWQADDRGPARQRQGQAARCKARFQIEACGVSALLLIKKT
jgi:ABC-type glutathione transport system ATPase component